MISGWSSKLKRLSVHNYRVAYENDEFAFNRSIPSPAITGMQIKRGKKAIKCNARLLICGSYTRSRLLWRPFSLSYNFFIISKAWLSRGDMNKISIVYFNFWLWANLLNCKYNSLKWLWGLLAASTLCNIGINMFLLRFGVNSNYIEMKN